MESLGHQELAGNGIFGVASSTFRHHSHFNLDDAFADGDDNEESFDFSPAAIRQEMAKNLNYDQWDTVPDLDGIAAKIGYSADPDASVSTFDIDASLHEVPISPPTQQPHSPESQTLSHPSQPDSLNDSHLTSEFDSVSLSVSDTRSQLEPEVESEQPVEQEKEKFAEYPSVQIDVSAEHPVAEVISPKSPDNSVYYTAETGPRSGDERSEYGPTSSNPTPVTPSSHRSEPSLPMPTSSSLPTPTPSHGNASAASVVSRHRPTKSVGPSALDKVISKTRPHFLPPKDRKEDRKHMADWETMMKQSRVAGESGWYPASSRE